MISLLSLDISAASTGWSYTIDGKSFKGGLIKTSPKLERADRLCVFYNQLREVFYKTKPTHVVIEDTFSGKNVKTLKILSEFAGVAKFCCMFVLNIEPYIISNHTVKAFFKAKTKKDLFNFMVSILGKKDLIFSKENDIIDAQAQLMCYTQLVLDLYTYRLDKEYGYLYFSEAIDE